MRLLSAKSLVRRNRLATTLLAFVFLVLGWAALELQASQRLTAKPYLTHLSFITLARYTGERDLGMHHFREGLKVAPQSAGLRLARMTSIEPRWGGSYREMEMLAQQLSSGVRGRRVASHSERARLTVTKGIGAALERIAKHHPPLGRHLAATVRRGYYCIYVPDPRLAIVWER